MGGIILRAHARLPVIHAIAYRYRRKMPFQRHPSFIPASAPDFPLWRYMSLPKYLSLLQKNALFFSNLEHMAGTDPFEGTLPRQRFQHREWTSVADVPAELRESLPGFLRPGEEGVETALEHYKKHRERRIRQAYAYRRSCFVNCWHLSAHESSAMWDVYSRRDEGIAVVSSEERIANALSGCELEVFGGKIVYGDYTDEQFVIDDSNAFNPMLHKRQSYSYEAEYRLVYKDPNVTHKKIYAENGVFRWGEIAILDDTNVGTTIVPRTEEEIEEFIPPPGMELPCDVQALIEKVYVSPLAPAWFHDAIKNASSTYGLCVPIIKSDLLAEPLR
jgi:hypothetical protein